jgi:capsid portal protein
MTDNIIVQHIALSNAPTVENTEVLQKNGSLVKWGNENNYPNYLIELFNNSSKNNAIIKGKVDYLVGAGYKIDHVNATVSEKLSFKKFLDNLGTSDNFNDHLSRIALDYELLNMFAFQVITDQLGNLKHIEHISAQNIRFDENYNILYSENWNKFKPDYTVLKKFNEKTKEGVFVYIEPSIGMKYYSSPEYIGSLNYIDIDTNISRFHLNNIVNGFSAGTMINFATGIPGKEEQDKIEKKVKQKTSGVQNAGEILISFSNGKDKSPEVLSLSPNNFDKLFDELNKTCQQEIFSGHRVTSPILFGISQEGSLGERSILDMAHNLFIINYVNGRQRKIEDCYNYIFKQFSDITIKLNQKQFINNSVSDTLLLAVLTIDELRALAGYAPLTPEQKLYSKI